MDGLKDVMTDEKRLENSVDGEPQDLLVSESTNANHD